MWYGAHALRGSPGEGLDCPLHQPGEVRRVGVGRHMEIQTPIYSLVGALFIFKASILTLYYGKCQTYTILE